MTLVTFLECPLRVAMICSEALSNTTAVLSTPPVCVCVCVCVCACTHATNLERGIRILNYFTYTLYIFTSYSVEYSMSRLTCESTSSVP